MRTAGLITGVLATLVAFSTNAWPKSENVASPDRKVLTCTAMDDMSREELLEALNRAVATGVEGWPQQDAFCFERSTPVSQLQKNRQQRKDLKP